ncbi:hypothetical protein [Rhodococcus sp. NPDC003383]
MKISLDTATQSTCATNPRPLSYERPRAAASERFDPVLGICDKYASTGLEAAIVSMSVHRAEGCLLTEMAFVPAQTVAERQRAHRAALTRVTLFVIGATSCIQLANVTATGLSVVCLLLVPAMFLMEHRGVDLMPLALAVLGWMSFLASGIVNDVNPLWPNAIAPAAFALYLAGLTVLTGRAVERIGTIIAGIAAGTVGFYAIEGIELTHTGNFLDLWKYGIAFSVTILVLFALTKMRVPGSVFPLVLAIFGLASLGLNFRSHALVCLVAAAILATRRLGVRIGRGWQFSIVICSGLVFAFVMPIAARAGLFGPALQRKTIEQDATGLPLLLAGRTEPPMTITAILEHPILGWGSAENLTAHVYTQAEHLAIRMGFDPTFPFELYWRLPPSDFSAMHSILLGSWAEGGLLAMLLPLWLLVACLGVIWNFTRYGMWAPIAVTASLQGIWDLLYDAWTYNSIPQFACIALLYCAMHFRTQAVDSP